MSAGASALPRRPGRPAGLDDAAFTALRAVVAGASGLVVDAARRDALGVLLAERLAATGEPDVAGYRQRLAADPDEVQALVEGMVVGETQFWRNPPQVAALRGVVLPELVAAATRRSTPLRVWSAGCSSGEEVWTVAVLLAERDDVSPLGADGRPQVPGTVPAQVLGTDISVSALRAAERGEYSDRSVALLPAGLRDRYLTPAGPGRWSVAAALRPYVSFRRHNLVAEPPPLGADAAVDAVLCRNVTIYFDRTTTRALIGRIHRALRPDGVLALGHSETLWQLAGGFRLQRVGEGFFYRKDAAGGRAPTTGTPASTRVAAPHLTGPAARPGGPAGPPTGHLTGPLTGHLTGAAGRHAPPPAAAPRRTAPPGAGLRGAGLRGSRARGGVARPVADDLAPVRAALTAGDYRTAQAAAEELSARDPLRPEPHYLHGLALVSGGEHAAAVPVLRRAVYLDPHAGFAHFLLASVLARLGQPEAAAASYRTAATTLGGRPGDAAAPELGGRSVTELVALCRLLGGLVSEPQPGGLGPGRTDPAR